MKSLLVKLGVILIGLAIFVHAEVWGADWKLYSDNELYLGCYDAQSITHPSKNIVRVWVRSIYTEKGVMDKVGEFGKIFEELSYSDVLYEINCAEKTVHFLSMIYYDHKGGVIHYISSPSKKMSFIPPESRLDNLSEEVCK